MFKNEYKKCFDDIKGDRELLSAILEKADTMQKKRIPFRRIYSYATSCAAILVIVSAVFLFNSGVLKSDSTRPADNTKTPQLAHITENNKVDLPDNTDKENAAVENNEIQIFQENQQSANTKRDNNTTQTDESTLEAKKEPQNTDASENPVMAKAQSEDILPATASAETDIAAKAYSGGGGGSSTAAMARFMYDTTPYITDTANIPLIVTGNQTETAFNGSNTLTIFEDGIENTPAVASYENNVICEEYKGNNNRIIIYSSENPLSVTDNENIFEPSNEIYKNESIYSAYVKGEHYFYIYAENISESYMIKITEALIN